MNIKESDKAVRIAESLRKAQITKDALSLQMGMDGVAAKDMGKTFLKAENADSWKAWCAEPGNPNYNTLNKYIKLYRLFGPEGMNITADQWVRVGPHKLDIIAPITKQRLDMGHRDTVWDILCSAENLSVSDLITEIKGEGDDLVPPTMDGFEAERSTLPLSAKQYLQLVKEGPCCVCGDSPPQIQIHLHHWPSTRAVTDYPDHVVPLCGECHQLTHSGVNFTKQIGHWLLSQIVSEYDT